DRNVTGVQTCALPISCLLGNVASPRSRHLKRSSFRHLKKGVPSMTIAPAIGIGISVFGAILLIAGIVGLIRDGRRIATPVYLAMGLGLVSIGAGLLLNNLGHPALLTIVLVVMGSILVLGNIVGYPALVIFLLYSG